MAETTIKWERSTFCAAGSCVEVAAIGSDIAVRDSKNLDQPHLTFSRTDWNTFLDRVAAGAALPA
ncbi:hypothetical protein BJY16_007962 [Actinoplanes octamycinicus]|uniref:DUF397 domain-containing protein n=1 Tax=Actinoplanes octamycinicus TaxID=135948 RepID=A0A7W7H5Z1_9ACTN|nr:DUF397 domain-containing protein [Actinoplanes octamycinicus]MBB4744503.1 hypothetical protein [Actinoplanes octamycinicus]GIE61579.1 hypothetical protein Aoc01nite_69810 [Actinoplanes octamycinicus]